MIVLIIGQPLHFDGDKSNNFFREQIYELDSKRKKNLRFFLKCGRIIFSIFFCNALSYSKERERDIERKKTHSIKERHS